MQQQSSAAAPGPLPVPLHSSLRLALTPLQLGENLHLPEFGLCWKTHADPTQSDHRHGQLGKNDPVPTHPLQTKAPRKLPCYFIKKGFVLVFHETRK